jgi:hypothetical protein
MFEVRFPIKILGFYVTNSIWRGTVEQHNVSREELVFVNFDYLSNLEFHPLPGHKGIAHDVTHFYKSVILSFIAIVSFKIFENILDHGNKNHKAKRDEHYR